MTLTNVGQANFLFQIPVVKSTEKGSGCEDKSYNGIKLGAGVSL